tara:strand:+ start:319 stop:450 length:132 start_codon:yes stop_codon:yes gene_type:complete
MGRENLKSLKLGPRGRRMESVTLVKIKRPRKAFAKDKWITNYD